MRVNVEKVLERDQKLSELDTRAGKLCTTSTDVASSYHDCTNILPSRLFSMGCGI